MYVYRGRKFSVRIGRVEIPGKGVKDIEMVEYPQSVVILPILGDGRILMIREYRGVIGKWIYELPAGTLEPGEDPDTCALRELREETGYLAGDLERLASYYVSPGYSTEMQHLYLARRLRRVGQRLDEDEAIETMAVGLNEALEMVERGEIVDLKTMAALLYYRHVNGRVQVH